MEISTYQLRKRFNEEYGKLKSVDSYNLFCIGYRRALKEINERDSQIKKYILNLKKKYPNKRLMDVSFCNIMDLEYKEVEQENEKRED